MPASFYAEFGRRLARRRHIMRLTQREVARAIGTQRSHISDLEHGRHKMMHLHQVAALAQVLRTSSDYLLLVVVEDPGVIPPSICPGEGPRLDRATLPLTTPISLGDDSYAEYSNPPP